MNLENDNKNCAFNKDILASTHINFLFGAGVNGNLFPQLNDFIKTKAKISEFGGNVENGIESGIDNIEDYSKREKIKRIYSRIQGVLRENYSET